MSGSGQTALAQALQLPSKPSGCGISLAVLATYVSVCGAFGFALGGFIGVTDPAASENPLIVGIVWFGLSVVFVLLTVLSGRYVGKARKHHQDELKHWEQSMGNWDRLFYCPKCDRVFDPETSRYAPVTQIGQLLC